MGYNPTCLAGIFRRPAQPEPQSLVRRAYDIQRSRVCQPPGLLAAGNKNLQHETVLGWEAPRRGNPPPRQGGRGSVWALTGGLRRPAILRRPCRDWNGCPTDSERRQGELTAMTA
jgi:hypothetical protein